MKLSTLFVVGTVAIFVGYFLLYSKEDESIILLNPTVIDSSQEVYFSDTDSLTNELGVMLEVQTVTVLFDNHAAEQITQAEHKIITDDEFSDDVDLMGGYFDPMGIGPEAQIEQNVDTVSIGEDNLYGIPLESPLDELYVEDIGIDIEQEELELGEP